jgi:serine/threonine protein kinase
MEFNRKLCVLKVYDLTVPRARRQLVRSVRLMYKLKHSNIADVEVAFEDTTNAKGYVQMPLYLGGPLLFWLLRPENKAPTHLNTNIVQRQSKNGMLFYVRSLHQVLVALSHIHSHGSIHGDLKLENILVNQDGNVKLADFDLSRDAEDLPPKNKHGSAVNAAKTSRAGGGTLLYMAPEVKRGGCATCASDIYSFGVCALQAFVHNAPTPSTPFC